MNFHKNNYHESSPWDESKANVRIFFSKHER